MQTMIDESDLLTVASIYMALTKTPESTLSSRMFDDGSKLAALRKGGGITVRRFNSAMQYLSQVWPKDAKWPIGIPRPVKQIVE